MGNRYHVFLSYNRHDSAEVERLAGKLRDAGLKPFFDLWDLLPGEPWQEAALAALEASHSCAVFLGRHGLGSWEKQEMWTALNRCAADRDFRVVPVLLAGADRTKLPGFLNNLTWVDFTRGIDDDDAFRRLIAGVLGLVPIHGEPEERHEAKEKISAWRAVWSFFGISRVYRQCLVERYSRYSPRELGAFLRATPDLERIFVPLLLVAEIPSRVKTAIVGGTRSRGARPIENFLAESSVRPAYRRIVILGRPGSGKTTLLEHMALTFARGNCRQNNSRLPDLLPILIYLRQARSILAASPGISLQELAAQILRREHPGLDVTSRWLERKLRRGNCLVLLDGLDEVPDDTERVAVSRWVDRQFLIYPQATFIITARPLGYHGAELEWAGVHLAIEQFSLQQAEEFLFRWYSQASLLSAPGQDEPQVLAEAQATARDLSGRISESPALSEMATNPLLLTMIAIARLEGPLPEKRALLFQTICDVLLRRRPEAKGITGSYFSEITDHQALLECIALHLMIQRQIRFTIAEAETWLTQELGTNPFSRAGAGLLFKHIEELSGLLSEIDIGIFQFAHLNFQEYLAASRIRITGRDSLLAEHFEVPWWRETVRLYASGIDASHLIEIALSHPSATSLSLAWECIEESGLVRPEIKARFDELIWEALDSAGGERFRLAVSVTLQHRLNRFLRLSEGVHLDTNLLSQVEYKVFADEEYEQGRDRYPLHWDGGKIPPGGTLKPITGLLPKDAESFCEWLSEKQDGSHFRLPTTREAGMVPVFPKDLGFWCRDGEQLTIAGVPISIADKDHAELLSLFANDCDIAIGTLDLERRALSQATDFLLAIQTRELSNPRGIYSLDFMRDIVAGAVVRMRGNLENFAIAGVLVSAQSLADEFAQTIQLTREVAYDLALKLAVSFVDDWRNDLWRDRFTLIEHTEAVTTRGATKEPRRFKGRQNLSLPWLNPRRMLRHVFRSVLRGIEVHMTPERQIPEKAGSPIETVGLEDEVLHFQGRLDSSDKFREDLRLFVRQTDPSQARMCSLISCILFDTLAEIAKLCDVTAKEIKYWCQGFLSKRDISFRQYVLFCTLTQRRSGTSTAWEGLRLARQKAVK